MTLIPARRRWLWLLVGFCALPAACLSAPVAAPDPVVVVVPQKTGPMTAAAWDSLHLARATHEWAGANLRSALSHLESIDVSAASGSAEADRAAFLRAVAYLRLGEMENFHRMSAAADARSASPYRQWLAYAQLLVGRPSLSVDGHQHYWELPGTAVLTAAVLLENGQPDAAAELLKDHRPQSELAATHKYLLAVAEGDSVRAQNWLASDQNGGPAGRYETVVAGQQAADSGQRAEQLASAEAALAAWQIEADWLSALSATDNQDSAWRLWSAPATRPGEIVLPPLDWTGTLADLAVSATNLNGGVELPAAALVGLPEKSALAERDHARAHQPDGQQWQRIGDLNARQQVAAAQAWRLTAHVEELTAERDRQQAYLATGRAKAVARGAELDVALAELNVLLVGLDAALADLDRTRDAALVLFLTRAQALGEDLRLSLTYMQGVQQFHVAGPAYSGSAEWPADVPTPAELLVLESHLVDEVLAFLSLFSEQVPALVNRSCDEVWVPRLAGDSASLQQALQAARQQDTRLIAALAAQSQTLPVATEIQLAEQQLSDQQAVVAQLQHEEVELRSAIVAEVVARGEAKLSREREGIAYLRSDARYWLAVQASPDPDDEASRLATRAATDSAAASLQDDLKRYPDGRARAENRYRLADLELLRARDNFQTRMAGFLGENPSADDLQNKALAPFVDYGPAAELYATLLQDDPDFTHRGAVLFQLGMILGDGGDDKSATYLTALVSEYPESPFVQEAALRLGDQFFEAREYDAGEPHFQTAAAGGDPGLRAIALYKLGWSHFEQDEFGNAATAFGQLLDHYANSGDDERTTSRADLSAEASEYLVHALIRSGGAAAFSAHFAGDGTRPYESEVLLNMAYQLSGVSLYGEAIACDRLWLERFGDRKQALAVSQRLVASYRNWHKPDLAREEHLAQAARFLPGQPWLAAHPAAENQNAAGDFARDAYHRAAVHAHQQARATDDDRSWQVALQHYESFLTHWPHDEAAARMHHQAGDAAHQLEKYPVALNHFAVAAAAVPSVADTTGLTREANWQLVAVTDAWYSTSESEGAKSAGADSLARRLLAASDLFLERYPDDQQKATLLWRGGQVAYAHSWFDEAAMTLSDLATEFPTAANALAAQRMSGDAWYQVANYVAAGEAYERTLKLAQTQPADSTVVAVAPLVPQCRFQNAQQVAAADTLRGPIAAAPLYADLATQWPEYPHADLAWYAAGLGREKDEDSLGAVAAWEALLAGYPTSQYARDSALKIAVAHETADRPQEAAAALDRFSVKFPDDADAAPALLKACDLLVANGDVAGGEALKTSFLVRFPTELAAVMEIRSDRARQALAEMPDSATVENLPDVAAYLALAAANPQLAEPELPAQVAYLQAQAAQKNYLTLNLTQPLPAAIAVKQASLENVLTLYAACVEHGVAEYARASAFHIGESITHFGEALLASERPSDLQGDDLIAYEEVLDEQSWPFFDRGEAAWTELLQQTDGAGADPGQWLARTRGELWPRVAQRFLHMPETEYPVAVVVPPTIN